MPSTLTSARMQSNILPQTLKIFAKPRLMSNLCWLERFCHAPCLSPWGVQTSRPYCISIPPPPSSRHLEPKKRLTSAINETYIVSRARWGRKKIKILTHSGGRDIIPPRWLALVSPLLSNTPLCRLILGSIHCATRFIYNTGSAPVHPSSTNIRV